MPLWLADEAKAELFKARYETEFQDVIAKAYRQVLGNAHVNSFERCSKAESQLRNGRITVREFVMAVGLSETYRSLFFARNTQYRFIELNFKHFLGRAPRSQQEVAEHVLIYHTHGYDAEILSYMDSEEYSNAFGENNVPYPRVETTQLQTNKDYLRTLNLNRGRASSDRDPGAMAQVRQIAANLPAKAKPPLVAKNQYDNRVTRYEVTYDLPGNSATNRCAAQSVQVQFANLSRQLQSIQRRGGRVRTIRVTG
ncbi:MAG: photosystem I reaction center subunit XII [Synechococcus sp. SB0666_bin_14]|nr:photosystem I reaction center subunit XII [Synechococcus sp. SB0666_bin_14]MYA91550.1 photosystem I reaction center subunit XII [Synechococcus sp. SB0663_bin_10]MYG46740.1 photosystem I reaction center subunit XII [Synechococcus sp. SB0675_bin_6]MYJ59067.1 photosystem I reaction center subunit XII [Synechococcus sp. SB0672_bin_6]